MKAKSLLALSFFFPVYLFATQAYVVNNASNTVSVINTQNHAILSVNVGSGPETLTFNSAKTICYVSNFNDGTISVIDAKSLAVKNTTVSGNPYFIQLNRTGTELYVPCTNLDPGLVNVVNTQTLQVTHSLPVSSLPNYIASRPNSNPEEIYVLSALDNSVSIINTGNYTVSTLTLPEDSIPQFIAFSSDGLTGYITTMGYDNVCIVNTQTKTLTNVIPLDIGAAPGFIALTADNKYAYVCDTGPDPMGVCHVSILKTSSPFNYTNVAVGNFPSYIQFSQDGTKAFVCNLGDTNPKGTVSVINTSTHAVKTVNVGNGPYFANFTLDGTEFYVPNSFDTTVNIINSKSLTTSSLTVGHNPLFVAFTSVNPLPPPSTVHGKHIRNRFGHKCEHVHRIVWEPIPLPTIKNYLLYCNGKLIAELSKNCSTYDVRNIKEGESGTYYLKSVSTDGEIGPGGPSFVVR